MRALLLTAVVVLVGCGPKATFDQQRWRDADLGTRERADMVGSLLKEHPLEGKGRAEIIDLLAPPTSTDKWEGYEMIYVLGPNDGLFPLDHEWLLIELDERDRVSRYRVVSD